MTKFIVSCRYWPTTSGSLKLRSLRIKSNQRRADKSVNDSKVANLIGVDQTFPSFDRRRAPRLSARCDAELKTSLAILDKDAATSEESLLFYGRTTNMSAVGVAFYLPSTIIDEHFRGDTARLQMVLHLPSGSVSLSLNPVRWVPLRGEEVPTGYLMGAQILSIDDKKGIYGSYLRSIADVSF